ncbi:STAS domain-containing protein [Mesobacillus subterraneus]|uniref:STAS domain-containing protein n=1 Tax=Mesobacillus subterraneus TaxID=285983 RepID=UPI00203D802D|nr:STAS domain-containing protein [Mesobacillus subterraneus]MCM3664232.1 STAS domain-containing protein [Mesobacillus subterraneus]MCM3682260.1 STAS domain-containing protein [Mesobacillus subterraneus]
MAINGVKDQLIEVLERDQESLAILIFEELKKENPQEITDAIKERGITVLKELVEMIRLVDESKSDALAWGYRMGKFSVSQGNTLISTFDRVNTYKRVIWTYISDWLKDKNEESSFLMATLLETDTIFNTIISGFSKAFSDNAFNELKESEEKYLSISAPIVPILPKIGVLPLVGDLDENRARVLLDKTLITCKDLRFENLVIDLSGTYKVDEIVTESLLKLVNSLRLIGIKPILTGLRADLSQQMILKGISFRGIEIYKDVMQVIMDFKNKNS